MIYISIHSKYIEIAVREEYHSLDKILSFAKRHFSSVHKLSNTILILDDSKLFKKKYFLNWVCYLPDNHLSCALKTLFSFAHLPIRIKTLGHNSAVYRFRVGARILNAREVLLTLEKRDNKAMRCILNLFGDFVKCKKDLEIVLDSSKQGFWDAFMELIEERIIGNMLLSFDFVRAFSTFATKEEQKMEQNYLILDSKLGDDFSLVRKKYLQLVKKYHPDNVFLADYEMKQTYHQKFIQVQNAFDAIRASIQ